MKLTESKSLKLTCIASRVKEEPIENIDELQISEASLLNLKSILNKEDIRQDSALTYYVAELCNAGIANRNGHATTVEDMVKCYKAFELKFVDVEHVQSDIVGVIVKAVLTDPKTKEIVNEEAALSLDEVNVSIAFIVWPRANPSLAGILAEVGDLENNAHGLISLSLEMGYTEYNLLIGSPKISEGKLITEDSEILKLESGLLDNGGSGKTKTGESLYRVIGGELVPLGCGLVTHPAAYVDGIISVTAGEDECGEDCECEKCKENKEKEELEVEDKSIIESKDDKDLNYYKQLNEELIKNIELQEKLTQSALAQKEQAEIKSSQTKNDNVMKNTLMKIEKISDITSEVLKEVEASEVTRFIAEELAAKTEEIQKQLDAKAEEAKAAQDATDAALKQVDEVNLKLAEVTETLAKIEADRLADKVEADFNTRMSALDAEFELEDSDRKAISSQIRELDEAGFATWKESFDVFASKKNRVYIEANKVEVKPEGKPDAVEADPLEEIKAGKFAVVASTSFSEDKLAEFKDAFKIGKGVTIK